MSIQHENRIVELERKVAALEMSFAALAMECKRELYDEFEPPTLPPNALNAIARKTENVRKDQEAMLDVASRRK
jgi:hypothetical protein